MSDLNDSANNKQGRTREAPAQTPGIQTADSSVPSDDQQSFKLRVLVVDDDESILSLLSEVFAQMGVESDCVSSSKCAAELIDEHRFDMIFVDWKMPDMDGAELAEHIRRSHENAGCPIVMFTGMGGQDAMKESFRVGVNFFLQKPISLRQLQHLLEASRAMMMEERRRRGEPGPGQ